MAREIRVTETMFQAPNLDDMFLDPDDLREFSNVLVVLARYAEVKSQAMEHRLGGNITAATLLEAHCQALYEALPEWARW